MSLGVYVLGGKCLGGKCLGGKCLGVYVLGVSVRGVHVRRGYVLEPCRPPKQLFVYNQRPFFITLMCFNWCFS